MTSTPNVRSTGKKGTTPIFSTKMVGKDPLVSQDNSVEASKTLKANRRNLLQIYSDSFHPDADSDLSDQSESCKCPFILKN